VTGRDLDSIDARKQTLDEIDVIAFGAQTLR
jgi:hypothetical protein